MGQVVARPSRPGSAITKHGRRQANPLVRVFVPALVRDFGPDETRQTYVVLALPPGKEDAVAQAFRQVAESADIAVKPERVSRTQVRFETDCNDTGPARSSAEHFARFIANLGVGTCVIPDAFYKDIPASFKVTFTMADMT